MKNKFSKFVEHIILLLTNPKLFIKKIVRRIIGNCQALKNKIVSYYIPKNLRIFIKHNKNVWSNWKIEKPETIILLDSASSPEQVIANGYFANILAKKYNSKILTYSFLKNINNKKLRKSYNCDGHVQMILKSKTLMLKRDDYLQAARKIIKTKRDVYEYKIDGIWIGIDIYETYLKRKGPTVDLADSIFWDVFKEGIGLLLFWKDYFESHKIKGALLSHDCYNQFDILAKVAYQNDVPVYMASGYNFQIAFEPHSLYKYRFINYRAMFNKLNSLEKKEAIKLSKQQLNKRLKGEIGVDMHYSTASAFSPIHNENSILRKSRKIKVLICTHCFYDNPHAYGGMLFLDFYEWLCFLGEISKKTDYDYYIKPHKDYLPGTIETLNEIITKFPNLTLISPTVSFHQLIREGISFALTCYGSIGHELPLLGVQVINAGYNPHNAYSFNWHPKSVEEYENLLLNLDKLERKINVEEIYEFYFIHYYYTNPDNLIYNSYKQMIKDVQINGRVGGSTEYEYFLNQFTDDRHKEIINKIEKFIDSGKKNYFLKGSE